MWFVFALGSALFAALTSILAKVGIEGVNSTLATAIRTVVVLAMSWGMVFLTRAQGGMGAVSYTHLPRALRRSVCSRRSLAQSSTSSSTPS